VPASLALARVSATGAARAARFCSPAHSWLRTKECSPAASTTTVHHRAGSSPWSRRIYARWIAARSVLRSLADPPAAIVESAAPRHPYAPTHRAFEYLADVLARVQDHPTNAIVLMRCRRLGRRRSRQKHARRDVAGVARAGDAPVTGRVEAGRRCAARAPSTLHVRAGLGEARNIGLTPQLLATNTARGTDLVRGRPFISPVRGCPRFGQEAPSP
jgi:hypothetical protein